MLDDIYEQLINTKSLARMERLLTETFKNHNIVFRSSEHRDDGHHDDSCFTVGIACAECNEVGDIAVEINWDCVLRMGTDGGFDKFARILQFVIKHELVHRVQYARSDSKIDTQKPCKLVQKLPDWVQYYADKHELMAMAYETVEQLRLRKYSDREIINGVSSHSTRWLEYQSNRAYHIIATMRCSEASKIRRQTMNRFRKLVYQVVCC